MRQIQVEVLKDIMYCALRQVLRDCGYTVDSLRKAYDVVYYQVGTAYHTLSLSKRNDSYAIHHQEQDYSGNIVSSYGFVLHKNEQNIVDLLNCLNYIVTERIYKELYDDVKVVTVIGLFVREEENLITIVDENEWAYSMEITNLAREINFGDRVMLEQDGKYFRVIDIIEDPINIDIFDTDINI